jgi:hypothetical protein
LALKTAARPRWPTTLTKSTPEKLPDAASTNHW